MFDRDRTHLGIAPTGWTNDDLPGLGDWISFEQCVSEMALAGFVGCGIGHKAPRDPDLLLASLALRGLRVSGTWFGSYFTAQGMHDRTLQSFRQTVRFLKLVGATDVVMAELGRAVHLQPVSVLANSPRFSEDQWEALVRGLRRLAEEAADEGLVLAYHPHAGTGIESREQIDRLLSETDSATVTLLLDTGHLAYVGEDPLAVTQQYAERIRHVHLKDIRRDVLERCLARGLSFLESVQEGVFAVPGDGISTSARSSVRWTPLRSRAGLSSRRNRTRPRPTPWNTPFAPAATCVR